MAKWEDKPDFHPDSPCALCERSGKRCANTKECTRWIIWFSKRWDALRRRYGRE